jgi:hypothetical protein
MKTYTTMNDDNDRVNIAKVALILKEKRWD